jgi:hypothetical protein
VFDLPILGAFKALHVMLWITAVAFLGEARCCRLPSLSRATLRVCLLTPLILDDCCRFGPPGAPDQGGRPGCGLDHAQHGAWQHPT